MGGDVTPGGSRRGVQVHAGIAPSLRAFGLTTAHSFMSSPGSPLWVKPASRRKGWNGRMATGAPAKQEVMIQPRTSVSAAVGMADR